VNICICVGREWPVAKAWHIDKQCMADWLSACHLQCWSRSLVRNRLFYIQFQCLSWSYSRWLSAVTRQILSCSNASASLPESFLVSIRCELGFASYVNSVWITVAIIFHGCVFSSESIKNVPSSNSFIHKIILENLRNFNSIKNRQQSTSVVHCNLVITLVIRALIRL